MMSRRYRIHWTPWSLGVLPSSILPSWSERQNVENNIKCRRYFSQAFFITLFWAWTKYARKTQCVSRQSLPSTFATPCDVPVGGWGHKRACPEAYRMQLFSMKKTVRSLYNDLFCWCTYYMLVYTDNYKKVCSMRGWSSSTWGTGQ